MICLPSMHEWVKPPSGWFAQCKVCPQEGYIVPTSEGDVIVPVDRGEFNAEEG